MLTLVSCTIYSIPGRKLRSIRRRKYAYPNGRGEQAQRRKMKKTFMVLFIKNESGVPAVLP
ncbi:hypothetical protein A3D88_02675 [Candidatus Peribacteria bacterium RIFCSPHIGHO2_02_FULL_52_16]|nr:MAG: hypothetical protein A2706_00500 [Candidatus Peribacteria bacterium RIFCSPHIGHO2_01_FULL_51_35]OGJ61664.1 MAG: hypothetical protein A3D88_02675 [Candidatus Peribacteria bacterium RIFCSPHIGHO2_02_FULL_52_16]